MTTVPARDALDDKVNRTFAGKVVRKDLVRKVKVGANVPVFVLEFLLGKYCASTDEMAIQMGLQVVNEHACQQLYPCRRGNEGAEQGQGEGNLDLHRQGEGAACRFRI
jgi:predicted ATP-dependent Lon-type protease